MNRLSEKRIELGLKQSEVAEVLKQVEPRIDVSMVSRYEKGVCLPTLQQLEALEAVLQTPRNMLYDENELDLISFKDNEKGGAEEIIEALRQLISLHEQKKGRC